MFFFVLLFGLITRTASSEYPEIKRLTQEDVLFRQLQQDLQDYFQAVSRGLFGGSSRKDKVPGTAGIPPLRFFLYYNRGDMDLFSLAARLNLPYDTLATLNGLENPGSLSGRQTLLVPNLPGLFVPEQPETSFQEILGSISRNVRNGAQKFLVAGRRGPQSFFFYLGQNFQAVERAYFLNILFRFPLPIGKLTSYFGPRNDPFTGDPEFHGGIDIAAPEGMEVFAARDGWVAEAGFDPILGNAIFVNHEDGYQTVYGHMSEILVVLQQKVRSGMIIGRVGSTGQSTGPHLHFEVRRKGSSRDPVPLLPRSYGRNK